VFDYLSGPAKPFELGGTETCTQVGGKVAALI
jgi:hypothetical protein